MFVTAFQQYILKFILSAIHKHPSSVWFYGTQRWMMKLNQKVESNLFWCTNDICRYFCNKETTYLNFSLGLKGKKHGSLIGWQFDGFVEATKANLFFYFTPVKSSVQLRQNIFKGSFIPISPALHCLWNTSQSIVQEKPNTPFVSWDNREIFHFERRPVYYVAGNDENIHFSQLNSSFQDYFYKELEII